MVLRANPEESADLATRSVQAQNLKDSIWHSGPQFLYHHGSSVNETIGSDASLPTEDDPEVRPLVKSLATQVLQNKSLGTSSFPGSHGGRPL